MNDCPDCAVAVGQPHHDDCDVARCLWTGQQRYGCTGGLAAACCRTLRDAGHDNLADELAHYLDLDDPDHDCGQDVWDGTWPGQSDCERLGFWCVGPPWVPVPAGTPGAQHDLNRLYMDAEWDRIRRMWVLR